MKKETFCDILGDIDGTYVEEAENMGHSGKKQLWVRWAAVAACLCLVVGGALAWRWAQPGTNAGGVPGGGDAGGDDGQWPEGVDPVIASIAQFPATEDIRDVADAEIIHLALDDLGPLGEHLPAQLPGGLFLYRASLYHTTMKDGTVYDMLRGSYTSEDHLVPGADGAMEYGESLCVMVYDHEPQVDRQIYDREALADYLSRQAGGGTMVVTFSTGDVYVNIVAPGMAPATLQTVVDAIP